ncbi:hypothetical protein [Methanosarcina spelaei]|uniref:hypothetical protein n=1 Tax=Methanosarcina spelaei TaxID=1036679 RepID=UPI000BAB58F0|nr:hypothetical protein [Methanosarcina spelaei]
MKVLENFYDEYFREKLSKKSLKPLVFPLAVYISGPANLQHSVQGFSGFDPYIIRDMDFSKRMKMHTKAFDLFQAWYNFIKPHDSLKLRIDSGNRKWFQRTPAMAEGITDQIWSLEELLTFRIPVQ